METYQFNFGDFSQTSHNSTIIYRGKGKREKERGEGLLSILQYEQFTPTLNQ